MKLDERFLRLLQFTIMTWPSELAHTLRSRFIAVEGVDGSGKTTQARLLAEWAEALGVAVILTREPGGTRLGEELRALILHTDAPCVPRAELLMILAARAQHVDAVIAPATASEHLVISDRFSLSSFAYQGYGRGLDLDAIRCADAVATAGIRPDLTLVVDVPLEVLLARVGERQDRFEGEGRQFLQRVIDGYHALAEHDASVMLIDGTLSVDAVHAAVCERITSWVTSSQVEVSE